jgi:creatinine amidohydrolase/Fe(II)-dependent formamide hydrolase-like protein
VLGDPSGASAEEGERLLSAWSADLISTVRRHFPDLP